MLKNYLSLIKFSHTIFALPFAIIGLTIGIFETKNSDYLRLSVLVVLCMVFARSAAMAFNRYIDRNIDSANPRTAIREIPAGIVTPFNALIFVIISSLLFIITTYFINSLCFYLSPVALAVVLGYSLTKRFTSLCHIVLGLGLSLAPIGSYLAVTGYFAWLPLLFSITVLTWVSGFDIIYALQDEDFDRNHRLNSIPVYIGKEKALLVSRYLHVLSGLTILFAGYYGCFGWIYFVGAGVFCTLLIYQHTLVKPNDLSKINLAFFTTNGIASVVFCGFVLCDIVL